MARLSLFNMVSESEQLELEEELRAAAALPESPLSDFTYPEEDRVEDFYGMIAAEQEVLQAPVGLVEDADLDQSDVLDQCACAHSNTTAGQAEAAMALEELGSYLKNRMKGGGNFSMEEATLVNLNAHLLYAQAHKSARPVLFSMESGEPQFARRAVEEIEEASRGVYAFLREKMKSAVKRIADVVGYFGRNMLRLRYKYNKMEKLFHELKSKKPKLSAVKPESWCKYLCYSRTGFDSGLSNVFSDVSTLVSEHMKMASSSVGKNIDWFKSAVSMGAESDPSDSYTYSPADYQILEMKEFHRSVGFQSTHGDQINFRSRELPGGKAFYLEALPREATGAEALSAFEHVRFSFGEFNPESWNMFQAKLTAVVSLPVTMWLTLVNPFLGIAAGAASLYAGYQAKYKDTTAGKVHIDQTVMFDVLKHDEMRTVLDNVRKGIDQLEQWNMNVLQKPWKSHSLDDLVDRVMSDEYENSHMRMFCNALIGYMGQLSAHVHTYAFKVYGAALNYVEKSCKQYT